jgi:hypothetical protein
VKPKETDNKNALLEPSQMAHDAVAEHLRTGGSTFDPRTGQNLAGSRHHAVTIAPEHSEVRNRPSTPQEHDNFVQAHRETFVKHMNSAVGTHHDPETGLHHIEIVGLTPSKNAAIEMASHLGEKHIHSLHNDEKTPTIGDGFQGSPMSVDDRLRHLHQQSPKREPYSGTHFSDKKLDIIEGARRGELGDAKTPSAHADSSRVHLGTKTGMGPDAPGGFYSVKAGAPAPAFAAAKAHSHPVRGQFAFGSTEHPEFKQGYADGVQKASMAGADPQTAHRLGLNSAEHALQDAGYDGYHSPAHPNVRFHFGDHTVVSPQQNTQKKPVK